MKEKDDWGKLLGDISPLPTPENLEAVIEEMLLEPLNEKKISRSICSNCGFYSGINNFCCEKMVEIIEMLEGEIPPQPINFNDFYFVTSYCEVCRYMRNNPLEIKIVKI